MICFWRGGNCIEGGSPWDLRPWMDWHLFRYIPPPLKMDCHVELYWHDFNCCMETFQKSGVLQLKNKKTLCFISETVLLEKYLNFTAASALRDDVAAWAAGGGESASPQKQRRDSGATRLYRGGFWATNGAFPRRHEAEEVSDVSLRFTSFNDSGKWRLMSSGRVSLGCCFVCEQVLKRKLFSVNIRNDRMDVRRREWRHQNSKHV